MIVIIDIDFGYDESACQYLWRPSATCAVVLLMLFFLLDIFEIIQAPNNISDECLGQ